MVNEEVVHEEGGSMDGVESSNQSLKIANADIVKVGDQLFYKKQLACQYVHH